MKTEIIQIEQNDYKGKPTLIVHFEYNGESKFTYVPPEVLLYWRKRLKSPDFMFKVGQIVNVFSVPNSKHFKIIEVYHG